MRLLSRLFDRLCELVHNIRDLSPEDLTAKLDVLAAESDAKNWKTSVVDLMKLTGLDHSLEGRRELAREFGRDYFSGTSDDNIWLHAKVMEELRERKIPLPKA